MKDELPRSAGRAVPQTRIARLTRMGGLASGIAGAAALEGARRVVRGERPRARDLVLTPANARRLTEQLAQMRGAAMKVGQLISMETGDLLSPELAGILARLRDGAHPMPPAQLKTVLTRAWGKDFQRRFARFDPRPVAAASIGQVHRAQTRDGRDLAIKVQYPGVRDSIDSDVANVAGLIRLSGMVPKGVDLSPLLEEARAQLHEEADYHREGACLQRFGGLLANDARFAVPSLAPDLTTDNILAMSFMAGVPIESLVNQAQETRDRVAGLLVDLFMREMFDFGWVQTDPNFANFRYDQATGQIILLDFGAARAFQATTVVPSRALLKAGVESDEAAIVQAAEALGILSPETPPAHRSVLMEMFEIAIQPFCQAGPYDFGSSDAAERLRDKGMALGMAGDFWQIPHPETLFLQRKAAGLFLICHRLKARVDVAALSRPWLMG